MTDLVIQGGAKTPHVRFLASSNHFSISGRSIPEDSEGFYANVIGWLSEFFKNVKPNSFTLLFHLEYFNTASSWRIFDILKLLEQRFKDGDEVRIIWAYDSYNYDMEAIGQDYQQLLKCPFDLQRIEEEDETTSAGR